MVPGWHLEQGAHRTSFGKGQLDIVFVDTPPFIGKYSEKGWASLIGEARLDLHVVQRSFCRCTCTAGGMTQTRSSLALSTGGISSRHGADIRDQQMGVIAGLLNSSSAPVKIVVGHHPVRGA